MTKKLNYRCPRCGYETSRKSSMQTHFYKVKKECPAIVNDIEITNEIKDYVIRNRIYKIPKLVENEKRSDTRMVGKNTFNIRTDKVVLTTNVDSNLNTKENVFVGDITLNSIVDKTLNQVENTNNTEDLVIVRSKTNDNIKHILNYHSKDEIIHKLKLEVQYYKNRKSEFFYQILLQNYIGGKHKRLKCGITDITTDSIHAEIKEWTTWKQAIGQLLCYNADDPKEELHVYLFGKQPDAKKVENIFHKYELHNIMPFVFIDDMDNGIIIADKYGNHIYQYKPEK